MSDVAQRVRNVVIATLKVDAAYWLRWPFWAFLFPRRPTQVPSPPTATGTAKSVVVAVARPLPSSRLMKLPWGICSMSWSAATNQTTPAATSSTSER